jgi:starvation-inducible DNA-binding protein
MSTKTIVREETKTEVNLGIANRSAIAEALSCYLANSYTLYLKTQNFHWNVTGPHFHSLHVMFEGQYQDLAAAIDELAERLRALGYRAPASYTEFQKLSNIPEETRDIKAEEMVKQLLSDNQAMSRMGRELIELTDKENDIATGDMIVARLEYHEKTAWMLRSFLG